MALRVTKVRSGMGLSLALDGTLDFSTVDQLEEELLEAEASDAGEITVDLRGLSFLDSFGLRALLRAERRARKSADRVKFVRPGSPADRVIEVTGADRRLPLVDPPPVDPTTASEAG